LFDVDGTLLDYEKAEDLALKRAFARASVPFDNGTALAYQKINDALWLDFERGNLDQEVLKVKRFADLFDLIGYQDIDPATFSERYLKELANAAPLLPDALSVIRQLERRFRLALITNGLPEVQWPRLTSSGLRPHFEPIVISGEVGYSKPHPAIFQIALESMGEADPGNVLIIGDSLTADMRGGIDVGMATCWMNPSRKPRNPDLPVTYEIQNLTKLLESVGDGEGNADLGHRTA
jgi:2-haloacid dehalogenase